ncbi:MAG: MerR family transcriptional regulator [Chloroflexi bacterium]|nr:MerR family transcriptional regulator [Chloroflexota bacterium]
MSSPTYNLKAVVQETGVKPDALRAWERRYGLPKPVRTASGHRLYSQRDVDIVKWLVARRREGLLIGRAVELWRQLEAEGKDPLQAMPIEPRAVADLLKGDALDALMQTFVEACLVMNESQADATLAQALASYPPATAFSQVAARALERLRETGDEMRWRWAAALVERRIQALILALPPATATGRVLVTRVAADDGRGFEALAIVHMLRGRGRPALYLPTFTSSAELQMAHQMSQAVGMILLAHDFLAAAALADASRDMAAANIALAFGGAIFERFPHLADGICGFFLEDRASFAIESIEKWLAAGPQAAEIRALASPYRRAREHFIARRAAIEASVWQTLGQRTRPEALVAILNFLSDHILAGLALGDAAPLLAVGEKTRSFAVAENAVSLAWRDFIDAYRRAAAKTLNDEGEIILQWLRKIET